MAPATFPPWAAPIVGLGVGACFGVRSGAQHPDEHGGNSGGLAAGGFIWLMDRCAPPREASHSAASGFARTLAVASVLLFLAPIVGRLVSLLAVIVNRRTPGWPSAGSWIGLLASAVVTILFAYAAWVP
jgi:hypothetical protein